MIEVACTTGGNHWDVDCSGDGFKEWEVVTITGAITVHAGEQDLACTPESCFGGPGDDVETAGVPTAVRVDPPAAATRLVASVDGDDDALATKDVRSGVDELGIIDGRGIDRNLVGAGREQISNVAHGANPPPTVSGMKTWSAVRSTTSIIVRRLSEDAVMSRNTSSSAPS